MILLPYFLFLITLHITLHSWTSQPHFPPFFGLRSQRLPSLSIGFSDPQAFAFFDAQSQWPAPFAEVGSGRSRRVGASVRSPAVPLYRLRGSNSGRKTSDLFFDRREPFCFWGRDGSEIEEARRLRYLGLRVVNGVQDDLPAVLFSVPVPEIYQLDVCDKPLEEEPSRNSSTSTTTILYTIERQQQIATLSTFILDFDIA